jgi:hypothetical protein
MKSRSLLRGILSVTVAFFALTTISRSASAVAAPLYMPGHWAGFSQSSMLPAVQDSFFDVFTQTNRRFEGMGQTGPFEWCINGVISEANVLNIQGMSSDGTMHLAAHGKVQAMGDGSVMPAVAALRYRVFDAAGNLMDEGFVVLIQYIGGTDWMNLKVPAVQGNWDGDTMSSMFRGLNGGPAMGRATLMFGDQMGSGFCAHGSFFLPYIEHDIRMLDYDGTVGLPAVQRNGMFGSPIVGIGVNGDGIIAILIGLLLPAVQEADGSVMPPMITGNYVLYDSFFGVYADFNNNENTCVFDVGSIELNPQPLPPGG